MSFDKMRDKFGENYVILFRAHYFISGRIDFSKYAGFVYDVSNVEDVNELYVISDILITDYSSVFLTMQILKDLLYSICMIMKNIRMSLGIFI